MSVALSTCVTGSVFAEVKLLFFSHRAKESQTHRDERQKQGHTETLTQIYRDIRTRTQTETNRDTQRDETH